MKDFKKVYSNGFNIEKLERNLSSFAFISLRTALKAYFSTYRSIKDNFIRFNSLESQDESELMYSTEYVSQYAEAIVHFQHFVELVCKEILRSEHELLVLNINNEHELLYELLKGDVSSTDFEGINTISFTTTLNRLCKLIKEEKIDSKYKFLTEKKNKDTLSQLNRLRNSIWHQGTFILHYKELDVFIGKYLLPIIIQITNLPDYEKNMGKWKYKSLCTEIDPIIEIAKECSKGNFDFGKVAFLKELGRSAYENPLSSHRSFAKRITKRAKKIAESEVEDLYPWDQFAKDHCINNCPVCGVSSLVTYEDTWEDIDEDGNYESSTYSWYIKCYSCSLELDCGGLKNPKEYDYNLPDYWYSYDY